MSAAPARILVIDDEPQIRRLLRITLAAEGFEVVEADGVAEGVRLCAARHPALVLLDLGLGDGDGHEALVAIRGWSTVPVIVLTVRDDEAQKIRLLEDGADDYVTKPFSVGELLARIKVALRKQARQADAEPVYVHEGLRVDLAAREVSVDGLPVALTRKEYALLSLLARHAGRVLTHRQLLEEIWGAVHRDDVQYLRVLVQQLRGKLGDRGEHQRLILTEQGVGYRLAAPRRDDTGPHDLP
ncbi:response regulator [Sinimarinibacterium flocculans]|uniref:response regulator n=1 Tax=Sinimarinibacterium flocculans TaxID=985250 RepID=UPI0035113541